MRRANDHSVSAFILDGMYKLIDDTVGELHDLGALQAVGFWIFAHQRHRKRGRARNVANARQLVVHAVEVSITAHDHGLRIGGGEHAEFFP